MSNWAIVALVVGAVGWATCSYYEGQLKEKDALISKAERDISDYVASIQTERYQHALAIQKLQNKIGDIDVEYTEKINAIQKENDRLADCLRSGKCGLRLKGQQTATASTGTADSRPGVDNGSACELDAGARQHYLTLRTGIAKQREQLIAAQKILLLCEGKSTDGKRNATK